MNRIFHHVTSEPTSVVDCLQKHFRLGPPEAKALVDLGAIYSNKRRVLEDRKLEKGAYLRVHLQPKRFPIEQVDWSRVIWHLGDEFLVVRKPAGIPVHPTVDNLRENVLEELRRRTRRPLFVTQRLDTNVGGLLVMARTQDFQRRFNQWLAEKKVGKRYRALVATAPALGRQVHYMEPSERSPRRVRAEEVPGWQRCELTVHSAEPLNDGFEVEIELHTGRTHQIRAQLAALGSPILGDKMYGSRLPAPLPGEALALFSTRVCWPPAWAFTAPPPWTPQGAASLPVGPHK